MQQLVAILCLAAALHGRYNLQSHTQALSWRHLMRNSHQRCAWDCCSSLKYHPASDILVSESAGVYDHAFRSAE